jgi:hypothetical protein
VQLKSHKFCLFLSWLIKGSATTPHIIKICVNQRPAYSKHLGFTGALASVGLLVLPSAPTFALSANQCVVKTDLRGTAHLIHYFLDEKTHQDARLPLKEFMAANPEIDPSQVAAVGTIICEKSNGKGEPATAQVTGKRDIITTAAHILYNADCSKRDPNKCVFVPIDQSIEHPSVVYSVRTLRTDEIGPCVRNTINDREDWAVLHLARSVPRSVTPYFVPEQPIQKMLGRELIQIAARAKNFAGDPRNGTKCRLQYFDERRAYATDCSIGKGSSGAGQAAVVKGGSKLGLELQAIVVSETMSDNIRDGDAFNVYGNMTNAAPVIGRFWTVLHAATQIDRKHAAFGPPAYYAPQDTAASESKSYSTPRDSSRSPASLSFVPKDVVTCVGLPDENAINAEKDYVYQGMVIGQLTIQACESSRHNKGVFVTAVAPGTEAFTVGIEAGDVILSIDDQITSSIEEFSKIVLTKAAGTISIEAIGRLGPKYLKLAISH